MCAYLCRHSSTQIQIGCCRLCGLSAVAAIAAVVSATFANKDSTWSSFGYVVICVSVCCTTCRVQSYVLANYIIIIIIVVDVVVVVVIVAAISHWQKQSETNECVSVCVCGAQEELALAQ